MLILTRLQERVLTMRHWFIRRRWPQLIVALVVTACTLIFASPGGALAAPTAGTLYTDAKLGFTMRLSKTGLPFLIKARRPRPIPLQWNSQPPASQGSVLRSWWRTALTWRGPSIRSRNPLAILAHTPESSLSILPPPNPLSHVQNAPSSLAWIMWMRSGAEISLRRAKQRLSVSWRPTNLPVRVSSLDPRSNPSWPSTHHRVCNCSATTSTILMAPTTGVPQLGTPTSTSPANGWYSYTPGTYVCSNTGSPDGWLFQCTDLANRFVREQWGLGTLYEDGDATFNNYLHGNAGTYFDYWNSSPIAGSAHNLSDAHLYADARWLSDYQQAFPSYNYVSSLPPQPGDLLIWQDVNNASLGPKSGFNPAARTGHVAVITGTDASFVYVAQQHYSDSSYFKGFTLQHSGSSYIIDSGNASGVSGRVAVGWIHFNENGGSSSGTPFAVGSDSQGNPTAAYARNAGGSVWTATQGTNGNSRGPGPRLVARSTSTPVFGHDYLGRTALYVRGARSPLYRSAGARTARISHLDGNGDPNNWTSPALLNE